MALISVELAIGAITWKVVSGISENLVDSLSSTLSHLMECCPREVSVICGLMRKEWVTPLEGWKMI